MGNTLNEAPFAPSAELGGSAAVAASHWTVLKFGGSHLRETQDWRTMSGVIRNRLTQGFRPVIVQSALAGATNALEQLLASAAKGHADAGQDAIRDLHLALAANLGLDGSSLLARYFAEMAELAADVRQEREISPRNRARMLALGELMATALGGAWLQSEGIDVAWRDARSLLASEDDDLRGETRHYLAATCDFRPDATLAETLAPAGGAILTQGYIAADARGETVLLGREGSDTSAAYLAARLQAHRVEIWTDVPGMFTADPKRVPSARLLTALHYDEARELASTGSRVLHPRCLRPLEDGGIPLFIRCIGRPTIAGTIVSAATPDSEPQIKGVSGRPGVTLLSLDSTSMRHDDGFVAKAFELFRRHGIAVALIATSQNNLTVTLDPDDPATGAASRAALLEELQALCQVRVVEDCAAVSLVGRRIRSILPVLAPAFRVFEEQKIHLVSQAANDLNFSFVVDEAQMPRLIVRIHDAVVSGGSRLFGPTRDALFGTAGQSPANREASWWISRRRDLLALLDERSHAFVYDSGTLRRAVRALCSLTSVDRVLYAMKANFNPQLLQLIADLGVDFECVSPGEVEQVRRAVPGLDDNRILFTPNFAPHEEYRWAREQGLQLTLDNLFPLRAWPDLFAGLALFIRMDPGQGRGHHEHVRTGGQQSKFGIPVSEIDELETLIRRAGATVVGIHAHAGSDIRDPHNWRTVADTLAQVAGRFPAVEVLDLGGGLGVADRAGEAGLDLAALDASLAEIRAAWPGYRLWLEPGRFLVAQCGVLLAKVTQTKGKGERRYVGVSTGMNSLVRPALYGAWHEIVNLTRATEPATESVTVVGPICETGDKLGTDRLLPPCRENDILLIANAGAYGRAMSSRYNLREPAEEIVI